MDGREWEIGTSYALFIGRDAALEYCTLYTVVWNMGIEFEYNLWDLVIPCLFFFLFVQHPLPDQEPYLPVAVVTCSA